MSTLPVLVAYASKHSATAEIAERIAAAVWLFSSGPFGTVQEHPTAPTPPVAEMLVKELAPAR